jgi:hypothetical protein
MLRYTKTKVSKKQKHNSILTVTSMLKSKALEYVHEKPCIKSNKETTKFNADQNSYRMFNDVELARLIRVIMFVTMLSSSLREWCSDTSN